MLPVTEWCSRKKSQMIGRTSTWRGQTHVVPGHGYVPLSQSVTRSYEKWTNNNCDWSKQIF